MNILFVTACFPGEEKPYYCIYLEQQARALQKLGNRVEILMPVYSETSGEIRDYHGLTVHTLGLKKSIPNQLVTTPENRRCLAGFGWQDYDAVSIHLVPTPIACTVAALCKKHGVKTLMHIHGLNVWSEYDPGRGLKSAVLGRYFNILTRKLFRTCNGVVGVSRRTCEEINRLMPKTPTHCVYNGVELSAFYPAENPLPREPFTVVCVANLIPIKGQRYLLEAMADLKETVRLLLIGEGQEEQNLRTLTRELGIESRVTFAGGLPYPEVAQKLRGSHMFIMPSCFEAFGCVFVEAMASGILTCGCVDTGADEIITSGVDGLLLPQKDSNAIARAIRFAMEDPKASEIARQGVLRARELSWERSAKTLMAVYQSIQK